MIIVDYSYFTIKDYNGPKLVVLTAVCNQSGNYFKKQNNM